MNKGDLISAVAAGTGLSKADAGRAIDATTSAIAGELSGGGRVSLVGFGTFSVSHRAARMGRNPATGASIYINASNVPKFKAGKALKEACNYAVIQKRLCSLSRTRSFFLFTTLIYPSVWLSWWSRL